MVVGENWTQQNLFRLVFDFLESIGQRFRNQHTFRMERGTCGNLWLFGWGLDPNVVENLEKRCWCRWVGTVWQKKRDWPLFDSVLIFNER